MATLISGSINVSKINKAKLVPGKNGAMYLNLSIVINDEKDRFGNDCAFTEGQTKEERERKDKKNYIGNGKIVWTTPEEQSVQSGNEDDLPF